MKPNKIRIYSVIYSATLLYFSKWLYLNFLRSSISEIQNLSLWGLFWPIVTYLTYLIHFDLIWPTLTYFTYIDLFDLFWPMGPILTLNWACLVWHLLLWKRGPKASKMIRGGPNLEFKLIPPNLLLRSILTYLTYINIFRIILTYFDLFDLIWQILTNFDLLDLFDLFSQIVASDCSAYISLNNGRILMFKVSKWPYQSCLHDKITCKWRQCLLGGQKWN